MRLTDAVDLSWPRSVPDRSQVQLVHLNACEPNSRSTLPKVLVGMLYSGESQITSAVSSLATQKGVCADLMLISGLPNAVAHQTLYAEFMRRSSAYAYLAKIDADMQLISPDALRHIVDVTASSDAGDVVFPVHDWLLDAEIYGLHAFPSTARWEVDPGEQAFVDDGPYAPRGRLVVPKEHGPVALHNTSPTQPEAFSFGIHRGSKVAQRGRSVYGFRCGQARSQFSLLAAVAVTAQRLPDRRRWMALVGAADVIWGTTEFSPHTYRNVIGEARFGELSQLSDATLERAAFEYWGSALTCTVARARTQVRCLLQRQATRGQTFYRLWGRAPK